MTKPRRIGWRSFFFFDEVGIAVWPREFYHVVSKANSRGKIPVATLRFLLRKSKTKHRHFDSPWFGFSYGAFAIVYSSLVTLFGSPRFRYLRELTRRRPWCFGGVGHSIWSSLGYWKKIHQSPTQTTFSFPSHFLSSPFFSLSLLVVTQIHPRSHINSRLFSPLCYGTALEGR